jgi:hypothetical protein
VFNRIALAVLVLSLCACAAPRPRQPVPQAPIQPGLTLKSLPAPGPYKIDSGNSEIRVLVYRAGRLANLGHNHVLVSHAVTGLVQVGGSISASSFSFTVPVESFVVDESAARQEEGGDFSSDVPEEAKSGTRRNMLSKAVLNGAEFPTISVTSVSLAGTPDALSARLTVNVAGREASISAPCSLQGDSRALTAVGSMELRQTAVGLTPYSLLHGALQVQDALQLKFRIVVPIS